MLNITFDSYPLPRHFLTVQRKPAQQVACVQSGRVFQSNFFRDPQLIGIVDFSGDKKYLRATNRYINLIFIEKRKKRNKQDRSVRAEC